MKKPFALLIAAAGLALTLLATVATPASAATRHVGYDGFESRCYATGHRLCLYYNSGNLGAYWGTSSNVSDIGTRRYGTVGAGQGQLVKNNAASMMCGFSTPNRCTVYFHSDHVGNSDWMYWGQIGNLYYTYNENASVKIT